MQHVGDGDGTGAGHLGRGILWRTTGSELRQARRCGGWGGRARSGRCRRMRARPLRSLPEGVSKCRIRQLGNGKCWTVCVAKCREPTRCCAGTRQRVYAAFACSVRWLWWLLLVRLPSVSGLPSVLPLCDALDTGTLRLAPASCTSVLHQRLAPAYGVLQLTRVRKAAGLACCNACTILSNEAPTQQCLSLCYSCNELPRHSRCRL